MNITPEQAAKLLLARQKARSDLLDFARYVDIPGVPADEVEERYEVVETPLANHHVLILDTLQRMVNNELLFGRVGGELQYGRWTGGEVVDAIGKEKDLEFLSTLDATRTHVCRRVMLMFPPGAAKSTYASVVFPAWYMGRFPTSEIILTGYGDVITKRHGKRARQLCRSDAYQAVFSTTLDPSMKAADDWTLLNGSSYKAAGILSGITGFRCDGLIWDDLIKGRKEADSETIRNDTWSAYLDDARSRKKPDSWEVGIGTRWHEDENMGRILPEGYMGESGFMECRDGNVWYVLCVPAQAERDDDPLKREKGEYLWPEWFGEGYWQDKKINPRSWASLYQQRPAPDDGVYFKSEWFKRYTELPKGNYYIAFDPAVTESEDADDTCLQVWLVDEHARLYLVDEWVRKCTMDKWIDQLLDWVALYKPMAVVSESGVIRRASEPFIRRQMVQKRIFAVLEYVNRSGDKSAMARSIQAMYAAGQVYHPNTSVGDNHEDELLRFPTSKSDHRVDSCANLGLHLEKVWEASPPRFEEPKKDILDHEISIRSLMPPRFKKRKTRWNRKRF